MNKNLITAGSDGGGGNLVFNQIADIRVNNTEGDTSVTVSSIKAYGGPTTTYTQVTNISTTTIGGFSQASSVGTHTNTTGNNNVGIIISSDQDFHTSSGTSEQGFYKSISYQVLANDFSNKYNASSTSYSFKTEQIVSGGATVTTTAIDFFLDDINAVPSVDKAFIKAVNVNPTANPTSYSFVSGIPTASINAEIETVFTINNLAHIFLRDDLKHADIQIVSDDGTGSINATTNPTTITKTTIDGSTHSYYTAPPNATNYQVSTAKYNTGGSSLIETSSDISIQFNDFKLLIDNNDVFDDNFGIKVIPYNLYGTGTAGSGAAISTADGSSLGNFRIDTSSINTLTNYISASTSSYGIRVRSGIDTTTIYYPSGPSTLDESYGDTYDNTKDISLTTNPRYDDELQLVGGKFSTPASNEGYKDYRSFYLMTGLPGSYTSYYDYGGITSSSTDYRFVTF